VGNFSRVFIRKDDDKRAKFLALMHRSNNSKGNENVVLGVGMPAEDLTLEEFRAILTNKPSYSEVTKAFRLLENTNVTINTQNITPIWG